MPRERFKNENQFIFYTWITTDENDNRFYLVLTPSGIYRIRCEPWTDIRQRARISDLDMGSFPRIPREFWTPSYCDFARGIFMAQEKSINQSLDNSEQINRPQTAKPSTWTMFETLLKCDIEKTDTSKIQEARKHT